MFREPVGTKGLKKVVGSHPVCNAHSSFKLYRPEQHRFKWDLLYCKSSDRGHNHATSWKPLIKRKCLDLIGLNPQIMFRKIKCIYYLSRTSQARLFLNTLNVKSLLHVCTLSTEELISSAKKDINLMTEKIYIYISCFGLLSIYPVNAFWTTNSVALADGFKTRMHTLAHI